MTSNKFPPPEFSGVALLRQTRLSKGNWGMGDSLPLLLYRPLLAAVGSSLPIG